MQFTCKNSNPFFTNDYWRADKDDRCRPDNSKLFKRKVKTALPRENRFCVNNEGLLRGKRSLGNQPKKETFNKKPSVSTPLRKTNLRASENVKQIMEVKGSHRTLFYRQPSRKHLSSCSDIVVDVEGSGKKVYFEREPEEEEEGKIKKEKATIMITLPAKSEKLIAKGTQTDYRESEAQTLPWKHEIKAEGKVLAELLSLDWFTLEKNFPPGKEEVTLIEKARQKLAWENVIERLRGKENERKRKSLVMRMAANETAFRETVKDEENQKRLEISKRRMKEAKEALEEKLWSRLQRSYNCRRKENDSKIDYWNHQLTRKIRKMKFLRNQPTPKWDIIAIHKDKTSDLYLPKLRDGENPSLGHEVIDIQCRYLKRFHGLEILEKHIADVFRPKFSTPGYESRSSKPKKLKLCLRKFREKVIQEPKEEKLDSPSLKISVPAPTPEPPTPRTTRPMSDSEENLYQASLLLGKIIKGRSIQTRKFIEFFKASQ